MEKSVMPQLMSIIVLAAQLLDKPLVLPTLPLLGTELARGTEVADAGIRFPFAVLADAVDAAGAFSGGHLWDCAWLRALRPI